MCPFLRSRIKILCFSDEEKSKLYWKRLRRLESSFLQDIFTGQLKSTLKCDDCGYCSTTFDPFWDLSLPIPKVSAAQVVILLVMFFPYLAALF